jgi:NDP-sugar pyrophosphorylase family protein
MVAQSLPAIGVIAGGLATRLHPITKMIPKSMAEVAGEPFVAHQLRLLARKGARDVVMLVGHLGEQIEAFVGDGGDFGLNVSYSYDGETLQGTGGAVLKALDQLGDPFLITYGDSYLDVDYTAIADAFHAANKPALLTVFRNDENFDTSNVVFDPPDVIKYSKAELLPEMLYIDYGILMLTQGVFAAREPGEVFDLADIIEELAAQGRLIGHEVHQRYFEIGSPKGLAMAEQYLQANNI